MPKINGSTTQRNCLITRLPYLYVISHIWVKNLTWSLFISQGEEVQGPAEIATHWSCKLKFLEYYNHLLDQLQYPRYLQIAGSTTSLFLLLLVFYSSISQMNGKLHVKYPTHMGNIIPVEWLHIQTDPNWSHLGI